MLNQRAIKLLQDLIEIESFSKNESGTAKRLEKWFQDSNIPFQRKENNLWAVNKSFDPKNQLYYLIHITIQFFRIKLILEILLEPKF